MIAEAMEVIDTSNNDFAVCRLACQSVASFIPVSVLVRLPYHILAPTEKGHGLWDTRGQALRV